MNLAQSVIAPAPAPAPLRPRSEEEHLRSWGGEGPPVVSVICATFNHAPFIAQALDGFLGQQTDFPFEVLVRDDASTDGTSDIVRDYAARYPKIVRAIIEPRNTFSHGVSPLSVLGSRARGEFVANCEGDDYWSDPRKLSSQVVALRAHPGSTLCFHDVAVIRDGVIVEESWLPAMDRQVTPAGEAALPLERFPMPASWMYRRDACDFEAEEFGMILNQDNLVMSQVGRAGSSVRVPGRLAVYRLHSGSTYSSKSDRYQRLNRLNSFLWISRYHFRTGGDRVGREFALAAMYMAAGELWRYGPKVSLWFALGFVRACILRVVDPKRRLRRLLRMR